MAPLEIFGLAVGAGGAPTEVVIVELTFRSSESLTWYLIGVAGPVNVGSGLKVTVPSGLTVYVP